MQGLLLDGLRMERIPMKIVKKGLSFFQNHDGGDDGIKG